jgi:hypothetical protein
MKRLNKIRSKNIKIKRKLLINLQKSNFKRRDYNKKFHWRLRERRLNKKERKKKN